MNDELKKLYDTLVSKGYYTNSYEEFIVKYEDQEYRDKVFGVVTRDGLYTKGREEFDVKYAPLKKKEEPVSSSQEEQLASPMETPTLASLPGRDVTLPPSPRLAPQAQQAIQEAGGVTPQEQPIPVPYETRPTEVVTDEGITMDLETAGITGEAGVSPEAQAAMETRIEEGVVEMPRAVEVPKVEPKEEESALIKPVEVTAGEWVGDKWNGLVEGFGNWVNNIREENSLNGQVIARFIEDKKDKHPDLYVMYKKAIDDGYSDALAANAAYMEYFATVDKGIENEVLPYVKAAGREDIIKKAGYAIDKRKERELQDRFFSGAVRGLMTSLPAMATSASTMGLSFMDMSYQAAEEQLANELAANPDLQMTEGQRQTYLLATAGIEGILERVGLRNTLNGMPIMKRVLAGKVLTRLAGMGEDVGAEAFEKAVRQEAKGLKGYASKIIKGGLSEFETGALQELSNDLINQYVTDSQGRNIFKPKTAQEIVMDVLYAGAQEAIGGGLIAGTVGAFSGPDGVTSEDFNKAKEFVGTIKREKVSEYIDQQVSAGKMERAEGDRVISNVDEFINVLGKIPEDMPEAAQAEMFNLVREKQLTLEKVAGKDDAVQSIAKEKVAKIDEKIKEIYTKSQEDAIQEQATSEVPVQPEAGVGEEVAEGAPQAEPEVAPEAGVEEEVTLTEEEQQQLADLRAETAGQAPVAAATREEVTATFEGGRKLSDNLVVNETGAQPLTKEQTRIEKLAVRGAKSIQKLLPDVNIILHASADEFAKNSGTETTGKGAYNDGVIHINLATADASTVAHEVFHAIFLNKVKTDSKAQAVAKTMMENVRKSLADDSILAQEIDGFAQNYDENFQNEERLAQLMGAMSREYINATSTVKGQIVEFIKRLARAFNVSLPSEFGKTDESVTAMLDVLARKVAAGKEIKAADLIVLDKTAEPGSEVASGTVAENISEKGAHTIDTNATRKQQLNRGGIDMEAIKRGSINDLSGANAFVFAADQATYGEIESPSGAKYNFKGGYLYPYGSGMGWAFTTEAAANKILKKAQQSDGVGLVMSQASDGITGSMSFYEYMLEEIKNAVASGAKESDIVAYVNEKLKVTKVQDALSKKGKPLQIKKLAELDNLMPFEGDGKFSYEERGAFTKVFFSAKSYEQFGIPPLTPTAKMSTGVLDFVNDPSLQQVQYGDIISAIQFDKNSAVIDTRKEGMDVHPSYPFVIQGTPLMVFNNAVDVRNVYPEAKPTTGAQVEIGKREKPQAARSAMGAQYTAKVPSKVKEEPTTVDIETKNAIRKQKGLITITQSEGVKYQKAGVQEKYQQQALKMIGELMPVFKDKGRHFTSLGYMKDGVSPSQQEIKAATAIERVYQSINESLTNDIYTNSDGKYSRDEISEAVDKINTKDVDSIVSTITRFVPDISPSTAVGVFIKAFNEGVSLSVLTEDSYFGQGLIVKDSDAITAAIMFEAKQADDMGLSRADVDRMKAMAEEGSRERKDFLKSYQDNQQETLNNWRWFLRNGVDDTNISPSLRLMLFDAVVTNNYDFSTGKYIKRNDRTLRNYTPYDEGTISRMFAEQNPSTESVLKDYVDMMAYNSPNVVNAFRLTDTDGGTWLEFPGGRMVDSQDISENANALSQLVQDTPWCTKTAAESQLRGGDFYVFVTSDKDGVPKPRIAIKTSEGRVDEVRGILDGQQMEPDMRPVSESFLKKNIVKDGDMWVEGQRVNERIKEFRDEISKRPLKIQDFSTYSYLESEANRYSFMQYGRNGFLERLKEDIDLKASQDDFIPELKGKVAVNMDGITSSTEVLMNNFNGGGLVSSIFKEISLEAMRDNKIIGTPESTSSDVVDIWNSVTNASDGESIRKLTSYVEVYSGGSFRVSDILQSLINAYGEEKTTQILSDAISKKTANLKHIVGEYVQSVLPIPSKLTRVDGNVYISDSESTGNIDTVGGSLYLLSNTKDFHIGIMSAKKVVISEEIKSLGNLTNISSLSIKAQALESLGNLESVLDGDLLLTNTKVTSLGNLKYVSESLYLPSRIKTLGNLEIVGSIGPSETLESLGNLKLIKNDARISSLIYPALQDLGKLESLTSLDLNQDSKIKSTGKYLKNLHNLSIIVQPGGFDFGLLESVNGDLMLYDDRMAEVESTETIKGFGNIKKVGTLDSEVPVDSLGNIEEAATIHIRPSESFTDTGKLKIVSNYLNIRKGKTETDASKEILITNLKEVGGFLKIQTGRIKSLGSIETIGKAITAAPQVISTGALRAQSVTSLLLGDAIQAGHSNYVSQELIDGLKEMFAENLRAEAGVDTPATIRRQKGTSTSYQNWSARPQSQAQIVGHRFNMDHNGFVPATVDPAQFKIAVEKLDARLGVKPSRDERTGRITGYRMTLDGKRFNPFDKVVQQSGTTSTLRRQGYGAGTQNIYEFINDVREKGYTDRVIAAFLKEQGYNAAEIKSALAVPVDVMGTMLPDGFANVEGGVAQGQAFFNELTKKIKRYANAKRLGVLLHNAADVRAKAQEMLVNSDFFKAQSPTIQAEMQIGLDKALNIPAANKKFQADFKALRAMLSNMKKGAAEMEKAKRAMRMFIRKNLPKTVFDKADVNKLMKAITDATPDSLPAVMERVTGFVNEFYVRDLSAAVSKLLKTPTTRMVSGRRVGRVSVSLQNILGSLTNKKDPMLVDEGMSAQNIEDLMQKQQKRFNKLSVKTTPTREESDEMNALSIALMYNEAMLMEDNNPHKVDALAAVRDNLRTLISTGRSQMRGELDAQRDYYEQLISDAYNGITGEELDLSEDGEEANKEKLIELKNKEERRKTFDGGIKSFVGKIKNSVDEFFTKQMDLALLLQRISSGLSEAMGGNKLMEIFDERLFKARVSFVSGKRQVFDTISNKANEIWGDNYKLEMQRNAVPVLSKDLINDKSVIWLNEDKANELKKEYESATNKRKAQIIKQLEKLEVVLSNNQAYYLYNQYKDPANVASFEKKFGKNQYARIMQQITDRLDAKTKEWADWQVNELYPSLYEKYNEVYKAIYRTNMPWNQFYAGRIFREGEEGDLQFDLLAGSSEYQTSVGGQSTKARVKNARPIQSVDGNSVLNSYLKDMEYFRAYAEAMRDLSKVLDNANVKAAIIELGGKNTYDALKDMMQKVARKGVSQNESQLANAMMGMYVKSKLAINPTVFLKQLTSAFAFADYIGYTNWSKYTALALPQARKLWKEWYANSPLLQERYENSNIGDILEGYTYEGSLNESPILINKKVGGKEITVTKEQTRNLMNSLMYLVKQGDKGGIMGGLANYLYYKQQYLEKNPGDEAGAQKYASEKATKEALRTQQDSGITNKDWFQTGGPAYRFLNVFLSSPKALLRREMSAFMSLNRKMKGLPTQDGYGDIARRVVTYHMLVPMVFQWVALGLPGLLSDWDDEDEQALGRAALLGNLNALFIVGDILTAVKDLVSGAPWAGEFTTLPIFEQVGLVFKDVKSFMKATDPVKKDKYMWRMINHITELTGIPASNIHKMIKNIEALPDSRDPGEALLRLFNYSDYVIQGDKQKKDKEMEAYRKAMLGE